MTFVSTPATASPTEGAEANEFPAENTAETVVAETPEAPEVQKEEAAKPTMGRGAKGYLEGLVKKVIDDYVTDKLVLEPGEFLTPHRVARVIDANLKEDGVEWKPMSAGSVDALFKRWEKLGFIKTIGGRGTEQPYSFHEYTEDAATIGLAKLKERERAQQKARRAEAKVAESPEGDQSDEDQGALARSEESTDWGSELVGRCKPHPLPSRVERTARLAQPSV